MKAEYQAPRITDLGSIAEVTLANTLGRDTDGTFPAGTPRGDLTFS